MRDPPINPGVERLDAEGGGEGCWPVALPSERVHPGRLVQAGSSDPFVAAACLMGVVHAASCWVLVQRCSSSRVKTKTDLERNQGGELFPREGRIQKNKQQMLRNDVRWCGMGASSKARPSSPGHELSESIDSRSSRRRGTQPCGGYRCPGGRLPLPAAHSGEQPVAFPEH